MSLTMPVKGIIVITVPIATMLVRWAKVGVAAVGEGWNGG